MHPEIDSDSIATDHVDEFAVRLVKALGREEAAWVCRENAWDGVLRIIQPPTPRDALARITRH